ncbi:MAG: glycoside hydrolase family 3 N-terminal domain-containing protein [Clostridia bacterium]|nr:glycoside hydrolase family 3 N-terminal domain-containing protein [Clostridia bacterium]
MFAKSFKWMLLTLLVIAAAVYGCVAGYRMIFPPAPVSAPPAQTAAPTETPVPTPEPTETPEPTATPVPTRTPHVVTEEELAVKAYVETLPLNIRLGQLVMFGFTGYSEPSNEFQRTMNRWRIGNACLYGINVDRDASDGGFNQTRKLINRLRTNNATEIPMLVSIDIEGGHVQRFKWEETPPSASSLGKKNDTEKAQQSFFKVGKKLKEVGINMNLAPVLDVAKKPNSTFLGTRIISSDATIAGNIGSAVIRGLSEAACLSTAKHFPGHGATGQQDSHNITPTVTKTRAELENYELIPFQAGIDAGVDTVLIGHILFSGLDENDIASMSKPIITDLLRNEMGFDGIVMSDDFRMAGVTSRYDVGEAAVKFINAGGDLILCGPRNDLQQKIMNGLTAAAKNGTLSEERINESVTRILLKKLKVCDWTLPQPEEPTANA